MRRLGLKRMVAGREKRAFLLVHGMLSLLLVLGCTQLLPEPVIQYDVPTDLYVDAVIGSDSEGAGTSAAPFKTISRAVQVVYASAGIDDGDEELQRSGPATVVHIAPGVYNRGLGESRIRLNRIELQGEGALRDDVKIAVEVEVNGPCEIRNIRAFELITIRQREVHGLYEVARFSNIQASAIICHDEFGPKVEFAGSEFMAIGVHNMQQVDIQNCLISGGSGIFVGSSTGVRIDGCLIEDCSDGIVVSDVDVVTVANCEILGCFIGITLGAWKEQDVSLEDSSVRNCDFGLLLAGNIPGTITGIGTVSITGSHQYNLLDERSPYSGTFHVSGIDWDNPQPSGRADGPTVSPGCSNYSIKEEGNSLQF